MTKTIVQKLNLQKYKKVAVLHMPDGADYLEELEGYDTDLMDHSYDLIFAFVLTLDSLKQLVNEVIEKNFLNPNGYIFLAYPKKGNKVYPSFIHRDELLPELGADDDGYVGNSNIKFSRMVGLDDTFTIVGLKEDARNKNRIANKVSQCVDDYVDMIPSVEKDLQKFPDLLAFYQSLTPGYQKDWARYIYSAKQDATKANRREEMKMILVKGYKSRDLFLRDKR
jgi:hypothetical protein